MKLFICLGFILLLASHSGAETYSWVDDSGTYNFTEDLSSVPPKYRKKANLLGDMGKDPASKESVAPPGKPTNGETTGIKPTAAPAPVEDKNLYDGKTINAWRQEMEAQEAELTRLDQRMKTLRNEYVKEPRLSADQLAAIKKEHEETRAVYGEKYNVYSTLVEAARKAGLTVKMNK